MPFSKIIFTSLIALNHNFGMKLQEFMQRRGGVVHLIQKGPPGGFFTES